MSDFDRQLYPGHIVGLRAFRLSRHGVLSSPIRGGRIEPGENLAYCPLKAGDLTLTNRGWMFDEHQVAERRCFCGFYGYWDGSNDLMDASLNARVAAVVKAYGTVTIGERGFRASKMEVLGVTFQANSARHPSVRNMWLYLALVETGVALVHIYRHSWAAAAVATGFALTWFCLHKRLNFTSWGHVRRRRFRKNYPDVKVYRNERAMLEAHPLTNPYDFVERK